MSLTQDIAAYTPFNEQESHDKNLMLAWLASGCDVLTRSNQVAHLTASAWVTSPDRQQVLMCYHRIYDSWSWLGGHADGDPDLARVALREVREESGLTQVRLVSPQIYSLETLCVDGHEKRGHYVPSHLHLNLTYLVEADPNENLAAKLDEVSGVRWFTREGALEASSEPWFCERIYSKLNAKLG